MKTSGDFFCDLIGEYIQIIYVRADLRLAVETAETVWSEGRVRGAYIGADHVPMFLLQRGQEITLSAFDLSRGRKFIRIVPPPEAP